MLVVGITIELGQAGFWIRLSKRGRPKIGAEALVGSEGVVTRECRPDGQVRVGGELWRAHCADGAGVGEGVVVESVAGLTLEVRRK